MSRETLQATELERYLYGRLDQAKYYLLINLKHVETIDSLGIKALEHFINRGVRVRLLNARSKISAILRMSGKDALVKICDMADSKNAASLFEKEVLGKKAKGGIKKRRHPRIDTFFSAYFKYHPGHNGVISAKTNILNLSEGGALAGQIIALNTKNGEILGQPEIAGQELYDLKFKLNGGPEFIKTKAECAREIKTDTKMSAGIRFKGMKIDCKGMIRDYVYKAIQF